MIGEPTIHDLGVLGISNSMAVLFLLFNLATNLATFLLTHLAKKRAEDRDYQHKIILELRAENTDLRERYGSRISMLEKLVEELRKENTLLRVSIAKHKLSDHEN